MKEAAKYPLIYACPIYFYVIDKPETLNSATVALVKFGNRYFGITNFHVIEGYREMKENNNAIHCQIGNLVVDPDVILISYNKRDLDIAVLDLTEIDRSSIPNKESEIPTAYFQCDPWPPNEVQEGEYLMLGGYLGEYRKLDGSNELSFGSYSIGACEIISASERHYVVKIPEDDDKKIVIQRDSLTNNLGGLSGSPAFSWKKGSMVPEYVGNVYSYPESEDFGALYIAKSRFIDKEGVITFPP